MVNKGIAFFDFDGTITTKDSLAEIIRYIHGDFRFITGVLLFSPLLVGLKLGLYDRQRSKERLLKHFFGGIRESEFQQYCDSVTQNVIPRIIRGGATEKLQWHKEQGHEIVLVSASAENWLKGWCTTQQMHCLATKLESSNGYLTGKILGKNCHGVEKVNRIRQEFDLSQFDTIYAYGDTKGDRPMLSLAEHVYYKPFR
jgi:phosphatidylglycerophosphatase C